MCGWCCDGRITLVQSVETSIAMQYAVLLQLLIVRVDTNVNSQLTEAITGFGEWTSLFTFNDLITSLLALITVFTTS